MKSNKISAKKQSGFLREVGALFAFFSLAAGSASAGELIIDLGRGDIAVKIPSSYVPGTPAPLLLLLHGYGSSGPDQEAYMQFGPVAEAEGLIYAFPNGNQDAFGARYWNGTDACCDFFGNTDDSGYLLSVIEEIEAQLDVDPRRIYITGHSNGGFMSYRMACDHSEKIAAIASLAGATWLNSAECGATQSVHVLQIHGTVDDVILFAGGCLTDCYPSAFGTVRRWAAHNQCAGPVDASAPPLDLDLFLAGAETRPFKLENCPVGGSVQLWTIRNGGHVPALTSNYAQAVVDYFLAHPKP